MRKDWSLTFCTFLVFTISKLLWPILSISKHWLEDNVSLSLSGLQPASTDFYKISFLHYWIKCRNSATSKKYDPISMDCQQDFGSKVTKFIIRSIQMMVIIVILSHLSLYVTLRNAFIITSTQTGEVTELFIVVNISIDNYLRRFYQTYQKCKAKKMRSAVRN